MRPMRCAAMSEPVVPRVKHPFWSESGEAFRPSERAIAVATKEDMWETRVA